MSNEYAKNERDNIEKYQSQGYKSNFSVVNGKLVDPEEKTKYTPQEVFVVQEHRYEGMSNPSDMSILYVIETKDNNKGTALIGYGPTGNLNAAEFFKDIPKQNYKS
ncbi:MULTISPECIES: hypothetical protein [unclassified Cellulophaga]|uniref:hypothetical protein n=1 Tax=unclassified Cellulophaga TaxID=2634405 RepID=UPI0026E4131F|nr:MULTISPECIES: hypothetical protein [unclassified Cellulophaga]MDO6490629.1 hypothetical protein [Cellulophaga sp. 2_MG-2023]MDO6494177.1 hypothetical protein [Cellulophaga sp. 3_MG-2023]